MPCDSSRYHPDWTSIVRQIKAQADDRCEFCGVPNGAYGFREEGTGLFFEGDPDSGPCSQTPGPRCFRIVLTIAHLNHDIDDNDPANLRCLCQKCHLAWDRQHHANTAATTRRGRQIAAGQAVLA